MGPIEPNFIRRSRPRKGAAGNPNYEEKLSEATIALRQKQPHLPERPPTASPPVRIAKFMLDSAFPIGRKRRTEFIPLRQVENLSHVERNSSRLDRLEICPTEMAIAREGDVADHKPPTRIYLSYLSSPKSDRGIYRAIRRGNVRRILEVGIGDGRRAMRLIELAAASNPDQPIHYVGVDPFEARSTRFQPLSGHFRQDAGAPSKDCGGMPLRDAYRRLRTTGAQVCLFPGDPLAVFRQRANSLGPLDLIIISAGWEKTMLAQAWFYVPRMLGPESLVFVQPELAARSTRLLPLVEVRALADAASAARARRKDCLLPTEQSYPADL